MNSRNQKVELPPDGAFCSHKKMHYTSCSECKKKKKICAVKCPDCGLYWMLYEGVFG